MHKQADATEKELYQGRQLQLDFLWDEELKEKCAEFATENSPKTDKETEKQLIDRLREGERCNVAGWP